MQQFPLFHPPFNLTSAGRADFDKPHRSSTSEMMLSGSKLPSLEKARLLALLVPAALLAAALGSQYLGGLYPCEMCHWQRWGHYSALGLALLSFTSRGKADGGRILIWLAALGILTSGFIGFYHAGVEAGIFQGFTQCSTMGGGGSSDDILKDILSAPLVRCDQVQWSFLGISMAGWNSIISIGSAVVILWLSLRRTKAVG